MQIEWFTRILLLYHKKAMLSTPRPLKGDFKRGVSPRTPILLTGVFKRGGTPHPLKGLYEIKLLFFHARRRVLGKRVLRNTLLDSGTFGKPKCASLLRNLEPPKALPLETAKGGGIRYRSQPPPWIPLQKGGHPLRWTFAKR